MASDAGLAAIVSLNHVPFGNQYFSTKTCGGGPYDSEARHCWCKACNEAAAPPADCYMDIGGIVAQHGQAEYQTNRAQACAKMMTASDETWASRYWPFVVCTEAALSTGGRPADFLDSCVSTAKLTVPDFHQCYNSSVGDAQVRAAAKATFDHQGTPTVVVNGAQTDPGGLIQAVCDAYTGEKPAGFRLRSISNRLRAHLASTPSARAALLARPPTLRRLSTTTCGSILVGI
jgi:hypothetical protein